MSFKNITVEKSDGNIDVNVYSSDESAVKPTIILCHGFCGIQQVLLPAFAEEFRRSGFNAITFDYRGFGKSGGERGRIVPALQIADIDFIVRWAANQSFVDPNRIGLWGTSLGGAHVIEAAAKNDLVKCVVSQLGFADGFSLITASLNEEAKKSFLDAVEKMHERRMNSGKEMFVPITRLLSDDDSKAYFENVRATNPEIDVKIPFLTVREMLNY